ncbi:Efflux pump mlcE [Vanrija pseudolonga]|uniref:Efflux pump mlcE n=1 Tax=Vanrija pseudolonga TaxID=143232 RepID=A0AAF0YEK7_9TREE|nr:Efflux pump mlcE [Vanrija pseudolonga]
MSFAPIVACAQSYSSRWTLLAGLVLLAGGNAITGSATSRPVVFVGRFVAGAGATAIPMSASIWRAHRESLPPTARRYRLSFVAGLLIAAVAIAAPLAAGALCQFATWRWVFYVQAIVVSVAAALCTALPDPKVGADTDSTFGLVVGSLIAGTQACVILTFADWEADLAGPLSAVLILVNVCPWLLWWAAWGCNNASYTAHKRRPVILAAMVVFGLSGAVIGLGYTAAIRLQVEDASPWGAGLRLLAFSAPMAVSSITALSLCAAMRCHTVLLAVGTLLLTAAGAGLVATVNVDIPAVQLVLLAVGGVGAGLASNVPLDLVRGELRHEPETFRHVPGILTFCTSQLEADTAPH